MTVSWTFVLLPPSSVNGQTTYGIRHTNNRLPITNYQQQESYFMTEEFGTVSRYDDKKGFGFIRFAMQAESALRRNCEGGCISQFPNRDNG